MIGLKPMVIYKMIVVKMARIVIYRTEETSIRDIRVESIFRVAISRRLNS